MRPSYLLLLPLLFALTPPASAEEATTEEANAERVEVGQEAPAFTLTASDGESYNLDQLRGEKNLVVVFFRGTW